MSAPVDLSALKARIAAATPGPWEWNEKQGPRPITLKRVHREVGSHSTGRGVGLVFGDTDGDAIFISQARTDLPQCVEVIEALCAALEHQIHRNHEHRIACSGCDQAHAALAQVRP